MNQRQETNRWLRDILNVEEGGRPHWAKWLHTDRSDGKHAYWSERKPQIDRQAGKHFNAGGRREHFNTFYSINWMVRINLDSGHVRIDGDDAWDFYESERLRIEEHERKHAEMKRHEMQCPNCALPWDDKDAFDFEVMDYDGGHETVVITYDCLCNNCFTNHLLKLRVRSPLHIRQGEPEIVKEQ